MSCRLILAPSFPELQKELLVRIQRCCREDPLAPKWVVTPTATAANHLRLRLAQSTDDAVLAGVRVVPFSSLVRRLLELTGSQINQRWNPLLDFLLFESVGKLPSPSKLSGLKNSPGGYARLIPTFLDLADGGFGLEQENILMELAGEPDLTPLERDTLLLYVRWLQTLAAAEISWEPIAQQQLARHLGSCSATLLQRLFSAESNHSPSLFVYGFYDFTDVNSQILSALAGRLSVYLFYPMACSGGKACRSAPAGAAHPAFPFAEEILQDLELRLGSHLEKEVASGHEVAATLSFFMETFPEGEIPSLRPPFMTFQQASGIRAEVISAAVRIRSWLDQDSLPPDQVLVIAPDIDTYADMVREIFASFAIPLRIADVSSGVTPENRALRSLNRIWEDRAPVEWILSHLRDQPALAERRQVQLNHFEKELRKTPFWGGAGWKALLKILSRRPPQFREGDPLFTAQEIELMEEIAELFAVAGDRTLSPGEALRFLRKLLKGWIVEAEVLESLLSALKQIRRVRPELLIPETLLRQLFNQAYSGQTVSDSPEQAGVLCAPLMRARGITGAALVVLGLACGKLPFRVEEDPLLSDQSRRKLLGKAFQVGHRLSVKSKATEEMALLFFLVNTSAERIHWIIPETDQLGKSVAPTPWVQRYLHHWRMSDPQQPESRRIPRSPMEQASFLYRLEPKKASLLPPDFAFLLGQRVANFHTGSVHYDYLFATRSRRRTDPQWNGHVPSASFSRLAVESSVTESDHRNLLRTSVTQLESLARCPYRFYAGAIAKWEPINLLQFSEEITALQWGGLLHAVLEGILGEASSRKITLRELAETRLQEPTASLHPQVIRLAERFSLALHLLPPVLSRALKSQLCRNVQDYLTAVLQSQCSDGIPLACEEKLRRPFPGLDSVWISGVIDRVDRRNGALHVLDYKSGSKPRLSTADLQLEIDTGYRMQPHLYPWIFQESFPEKEKPDFSYIFFGDEQPLELAVVSLGRVEEILSPLGGLLAGGYYFITSNESLAELLKTDRLSPCQWCEFISLCRRFDGRSPFESTRFFTRRAEQRVAALSTLLKASSNRTESGDFK